MRFRLSDGFHPGHKHHPGHVAHPSSPHTLAPSAVDTGDNSAGNGGDGHFSGYLIDNAHAAFGPVNAAESGGDAAAAAHQANIAYFNQGAVQMAGIGGGGGDGNAAIGGSAGGAGPTGLDAIASGDNGAGNGGNGSFAGSLVHAPVAIFDPVNIAIAGFHGTADAQQSNAAQFDQSASQLAGVGGSGGNGNLAAGGEATSAASPWAQHVAFGSSPAPAAAISSGDNSAGNGGEGSFYGSMVHTAVAVYDPINIAVAGYDSTSIAVQSNNAQFDQSALQMAGIGGQGGNGNAAAGGGAEALSSMLGLIGSDVIATGGNSAGSGGSGHFAGSLLDLSIAIYAPINIAIAGPNSTAEADQTNSAAFDQGAVQIAGIGGDGGHGNMALGGDIALHLLSDLHLLGHA